VKTWPTRLTVTAPSFGAAQNGNLGTAMSDNRASGTVDAWSELSAAAAQFPLAHPAVASVCLGMRSPGQVRRNAALLATPVPGELWPALKAEGLLREDAPAPGA
jgi:hypothetical protein